MSGVAGVAGPGSAASETFCVVDRDLDDRCLAIEGLLSVSRVRDRDTEDAAESARVLDGKLDDVACKELVSIEGDLGSCGGFRSRSSTFLRSS